MKVGFTAGAFDLLHPGHLFFLKSCAERCDQLIVGLHTDPTIDRPSKNKPLQTVYERWYQLVSTQWVDQVVPYETEKDLENLLLTLDINIRFLGWDYIDQSITAKWVCDQRNIDINYIPRSHQWSSTELRGRLVK